MASGVSANKMSEEERNCLVFYHLTTKVGVQAIRICFDILVPPATMASFLNVKKNKLQKLLQQKQLNMSQFKVMYPQAGTVASIDFDITLMVFLIRHILKVTPPPTGWDALPNPNDVTQEADIARIKYYRNNFLAHLPSAELSNVEFNKASTNVRKAISRLSNTSLDAEVQNILDMTVIPSQDLQALQKELDCLKNVIPRHIQDQNTAVIDSWKKTSADYVETSAYRHVREKVRTSAFTTIGGNSGSGKSSIAHGIALEMEADGYTIVPISTVEELKSYIDPKSKQVFIMDDPVGNGRVDEVALLQFQSYTQMITDIVNNSQIKVVITCRRVILNDKRVTNSLLCKNVADINDTNLRLTSQEKEAILNQYLKHVDNKLLAESKSSIINLDFDHFPLLCKIFSCNKCFQTLGDAFFEDMFKYLIDELKIVQNQHKIQFCCLLVCLFYDNSFDQDILNVFSHISEDDKSKLNQIIEVAGLPSNTSRTDIENTMAELVGVYFKKEGSRYKFIHDALYDAVSFLFGSKFPKEVLKWCSSSFILDRIRLSTCTDHLSIVLNSNCYRELAARFFNEMKSGNYSDVFLYPAITELQELLIECFKEAPNHDIRHMLQVERNSELIDFNMDNKKENNTQRLFVLRILKSENIKLIHWILAMDLSTLFKFVNKTYTINFDSLNLLPIACLSGNLEISDMLLQQKSNCDISDTWCSDIFEDKISTLYMAVISGKSAMVRYVLKQYSNANIIFGESLPLLTSVLLDFIDICRMLLEAGADVNMAYKYGYTPLYIASQEGHADIAKLLIGKGADVNKYDNDGWTPLYIASQEGHNDIVKILIDKGGDVNMPENDLCTPLHIASQENHLEVVNVLLDKGANTNIAMNTGCTPLYTASRKGHICIVNSIVNNGCDVNIADNNGCTSLYVASQQKHIGIMNVLIDNGASVNMADCYGRTPIYSATEIGHCDIVTFLTDKGASVNITDSNGCSPLFVAVQKGHINIFKVLIDNGADVNMTKKIVGTPLCVASQCNNVDIVNILLDNRADINMARIKDGCSPLHIAVGSKHTDIVRILTDRNASVNTVDLNGRTPLYIASQINIISIVKILIDRNADVNTAKKGGTTPLYIASKRGHTDVVKFLIDKGGADVNITDNDGFTPLYIASQEDQTEIVEFLVDKGADINMPNKDKVTPLNIASDKGHTDIVNVLIDNGADLNIAEKFGCTPLYIASYRGHIGIVNALIDKGASVNIAENNGCSPLCIASQNGHTCIVQILIDKGADVNMTLNNGRSSLYIASHIGHIEIVKVLLDKGADVNMADHNGRTPLYIASRNKRTDILKILKQNVVRKRIDNPVQSKSAFKYVHNFFQRKK